MTVRGHEAGVAEEVGLEAIPAPVEEHSFAAPDLVRTPCTLQRVTVRRFQSIKVRKQVEEMLVTGFRLRRSGARGK